MKKSLLCLMLLICLIMSIFAQNIITNDYYVCDLFGTYLRSEPNIKSEKLGIIPFKQKVNVLKQDNILDMVNSIKNYWYFIEYREKKGWVFGGYLTNYNIDELYNLLKKKKKYYDNLPYENCEQKFSEITQIYDKYIVVMVRAPLKRPDLFSIGEVLYVYESGKLKKYNFGNLYKEFGKPMWYIRIAHINDDNLPDLIYSGGDSGSEHIYYFENNGEIFLEKNHITGRKSDNNNIILNNINSVLEIVPDPIKSNKKILRYIFSDDKFILKDE